MACICLNQDGKTIIDGEARVIAPRDKVHRPGIILPDVHLHVQGAKYARLIAATKDLKPIRAAVVHACDALSSIGALDAAQRGMIPPVLVGPKVKIEAAALKVRRSLDSYEIIDTPHSHTAAATAVALVRASKVEALMKGPLHTDELMEAVVDTALGLQTERRMSHVYVPDVPTYPKPLLITNAAIDIYPNLAIKRDIVQNAIDLALSLGIQQPKVAILSALETVYPRIASTLDAAALCKMADRGQITGGLLDSPLAFDNAISETSVASKGIVSDVAGIADILVAPDLSAANMLAKQLIYLAEADAAGIVLGARVPIILTSRADTPVSRLASRALAQLFISHQTKAPS